jgi:alpha-glucosidase
VLMVNPTPTGLLEANDMVLNLSPPCALADTSWIKPGKVTFPWWSGFWGGHGTFPHDVNTAMFKYYIDFAARTHLEYIEVSDYWYKGPNHSVKEDYPPDEVDITQQSANVDIQEVLAYARQKSVKCLLWLDWPPLKKQMDVALPLYEKWGAAGVKVDLMDRDDQEMVNFYDRVAERAAAHHLLVYFHGAYKPTGLRRTYPNVLNRESVLGLEHDKVEYTVTPDYDVTMPFVRLLAGPMDYTPGAFRNATHDQFKPQFVQPMAQGTRAHELAKYVVYLAPLEMVSDDPEAYQGQPEFAFLQAVPTVWDETKVLNGEPGKFITVAREKDGAWYVGTMTNGDARDVKLPLSFLSRGTYRAQIFADGADADRVAAHVQISEKTVNRDDILNLVLAPGGGAAIILTPVK